MDCVEIGFKLGTEKFGENVIRRTGLLFRAVYLIAGLIGLGFSWETRPLHNLEWHDIGGRDRNRTDVHGFAIRCIATLPLGRSIAYC